mgnify:CR=1 FL=1
MPFDIRNITHLDCTLRDGGYYTNWSFDSELVNNYFSAIKKAGIKVVEIGYCSFSDKSFKGPFAYCKESFISNLNIPNTLKVAVMIEAKNLINLENIDETLDNLFPYICSKSRIDIIRIACNIKQLSDIKPILDNLAKKGFTLCLNLMHAAKIKLDQVNEITQIINTLPIEVFYLADSTGSMYPSDIESLFKLFSKKIKIKLGIHAHNNLDLAHYNSIVALKSGAGWIDSTIDGIGRGPGNAKTEFIAIELNKFENVNFDINDILSLNEIHFKKLKENYKWGSNPYYYLTGLNKIHPSYVQTLLQNSRTKPKEIITLIDFLKTEKLAEFRSDILKQVKYLYPGDPSGKWSPKNYFKNTDLLLIGTGPSSVNYKEALEEFIKMYKPKVIAINLKSSVKEELIDYRVSCNPLRLMSDNKSYKNLNKPLITPVTMLDKKYEYIFNSINTLDYGFKVNKNSFKFNEYYATIPKPLTLAYALAIITYASANKIFLAGFDGYENSVLRNNTIRDIFNIYNSLSSKLKLEMLTPSIFNIPSISVYSYL